MTTDCLHCWHVTAWYVVVVDGVAGQRITGDPPSVTGTAATEVWPEVRCCWCGERTWRDDQHGPYQEGQE